MVSWSVVPGTASSDCLVEVVGATHWTRTLTVLPAFTFEARPVVPVADAIRVELEAMAYRDGLKK
jgi:hypothetical protein